MNLIIKDEKLPDSCGECQNKYGVCTSNYRNYDDYVNSPPSDCPLDEFPTHHGRLIDADDLIMRIENSDYYFEELDSNIMYTPDIVKVIHRAPTVIEEDLE